MSAAVPPYEPTSLYLNEKTLHHTRGFCKHIPEVKSPFIDIRHFINEVLSSQPAEFYCCIQEPPPPPPPPHVFAAATTNFQSEAPLHFEKWPRAVVTLKRCFCSGPIFFSNKKAGYTMLCCSTTQHLCVNIPSV